MSTAECSRVGEEWRERAEGEGKRERKERGRGRESGEGEESTQRYCKCNLLSP